MRTVSLRVPCGHGHPVDVGIDDVAIAHTDWMVVGYSFVCPKCGVRNEVSAAADVVAVLHAFGVSDVRSIAADRATPVPLAGARRQIVSLRVLLDHPEAFGGFARPAQPSVSEGDATTTP